MGSAAKTSPKVVNDDTVLIDGSDTSAAIDLRGKTLCGIFVPASFVGTSLTFSTSLTKSGTYVSMRDGAGSAYSKTIAASQFLPLNPQDFAGVRFLKVISSATETSKTLTLATRNIA